MKLKQTRIKLRLKLKKFFLNVRNVHLKDLRNVVLLYIKKLPNIVHLKNLVLFNTILATVVFIMFFQRFSALSPYYQKVQPSFGGYYREGVIGNIEKINPLFIMNNAEAEATRLVFSGLTRVMPENKVIPDLAESWQVSPDGYFYDFRLKKDLKWHDGKPLNADDIIYTINLIQNPDTKTSQQLVWKGVGVEKISDYEVRFKLSTPYSNFLSVAAQPILPKHLLEEISPQNIKIAEFNKSPIGSGPYKFVRFDQTATDIEVIFESFKDFAIQRPYISQIKLVVYDSFDNLYNGILRKQIDGITQIPFDKVEKVSQNSNLNTYNIFLPRYQSIVLNLKNKFLSDKNIRKAISFAINRDEIIKYAVNNQAMKIYGPILPGEPGYDPSLRKETYNLNSANQILESSGWTRGQNGYRQKEGKALSLSLISLNDKESLKAADLIKTQLSLIGVEARITTVEQSDLQSNYMRPRNFDMILIGQESSNSDIYSFLHSSQVTDPGLNISGFSNRRVDKLLEQSRKSNNPIEKDLKYKEIQAVVSEEVPIVYLYNPLYTFGLGKNIKGYEIGNLSSPIDHLNSVYLWYSRIKKSY